MVQTFGKWIGLVGAKGIPVEPLAGSPFHDSFVPSLVLLLIVGGSLLTAAIAVLTRARIARTAALAAGVILIGWIAVQMAIIGYLSSPETRVRCVLDECGL